MTVEEARTILMEFANAFGELQFWDALIVAAAAEANDAFLDAGDALELSVRSAVVPQERNMLLSIRHADMDCVAIVANESFQLDPRLVG